MLVVLELLHVLHGIEGLLLLQLLSDLLRGHEVEILLLLLQRELLLLRQSRHRHHADSLVGAVGCGVDLGQHVLVGDCHSSALDRIEDCSSMHLWIELELV